jgi:hypothetical protein
MKTDSWIHQMLFMKINTNRLSMKETKIKSVMKLMKIFEF